MSKSTKVVIPVDVAEAVGLTRSEFAKLPAGAKIYYARLVYSEQSKSGKIVPFKHK